MNEPNNSELQQQQIIYNQVTERLIGINFPSDFPRLNKAHLLVIYHNELESGGHESFLNWQQNTVRQIGIQPYMKDLVAALQEIGAKDYANVIEQFGEHMWNLFEALENGEIDESLFYEVIELADQAYFKLNGAIRDLLEVYLLKHSKQLLEELDNSGENA
jgi:hypothetical protein